MFCFQYRYLLSVRYCRRMLDPYIYFIQNITGDLKNNTDTAFCTRMSDLKEFFENGQYFNEEPGQRNIIKVKPMVSDQVASVSENRLVAKCITLVSYW